MGVLTWLHISDLHVTENNPDWHAIRDALLKDIEEHQDPDLAQSAPHAGLVLKPQLIFITGDFTKKGKANEYNLGRAFLDQLWKVTKLDKSRTFIVPGNHDVDLGIANEDYACRTLREKLSSHSLDEHKLTDELNGFWKDHDKFFEKHKHFMNEAAKLSAVNPHPTYFVKNVDFLPDLPPIDIVGVNSAWMCGEDDEDICRELIIGLPQMEEIGSKLQKMDRPLRIALVHHPFEHLHPSDDSARVLKEYCPIILMGHHHKQRPYYGGEPLQQCLSIPAGAIYQKSRFSEHAYNYVQLDVDSGELTVFLRRATVEAHPRYIRDSQTFPVAAPEGRYPWLIERLAPPGKAVEKPVREAVQFPTLGFGKIASERLTAMIQRKYHDLTRGIVALNVQELAMLWAEMFPEQNIIYFRATSLINPELWQNEFMSRYSGEQRYGVTYFNNLTEEEKVHYQDLVASFIPGEELGDSNYERTFIITRDQLANTERLASLIEVICRQSNYMPSLMVRYEKGLSSKDKVDIGIAISKNGDVWIYDLDVLGGSLYGGHLLLDRTEIDEAIDRYRIIRAGATEIPSGSQFHDVAKIIDNLCEEQVDWQSLNAVWEQRQRKGYNKCKRCLRDSEKRIERADWRTLQPAKRRWYEIIDLENKLVETHVLKHRPKRIIEVGCGPGRLINIIQKLQLGEIERIVGIEGDPEMYDYAYKRFQESEKIRILQMFVGKILPFDNDYFDYCINASNIAGWQVNGGAWLEEMIRCSKMLFFTLYKKGYELERLKMYETRKHTLSEKDVHIGSDGQIVLGDCTVIPGVESRAYPRDKVEDLCEQVSSRYGARYEIDDKSSELIYVCLISKV